MADFPPLPKGFTAFPDLPEGFTEVEYPELPEGFKAKESTQSFLGQVKEGITSPFVGSTKQREYSPETKKAAKEFLKGRGFNPDSKLDAIWTSMLGFVDAGTGGNQAEIQAAGQKLEDFIGLDDSGMSYEQLRDMYEAAYKMREEAQPKSAITGEIGGYLGPGLGLALSKAGVLAKGVAGSTIGTLQGAAGASDKAAEGLETEAVARGLAEGAVITTALGGLGKAISVLRKAPTALAKKNAERVLKDSGFDSEQAERIGEAFVKERALLDDTISGIKSLSSEERKEFRKVMLDDMPWEDVEKYGDIGKALDQYKDLLARRTATLSEAGMDPQKSSRLANFLLDAQYVGDIVDRRWSTNFMRNMNNVSDDMNKATHLSSALKKQAKSTINKFRPKGLEDSKRIIKAVEDGVDSPEVNAYRDLFKSMADQANDAAIKGGYGKGVVKLRPNYTPHYMRKSTEVVALLKKRIEDVLGAKPKEIGSKELAAIAKDEKLMDSLAYVGGFNFKKPNMSIVKDTIENLYASKKWNKMDRFTDLGASSIRSRKEEFVPELIREHDIGRLAGGWIDSVPQDIMTRNNIRKIRAEATAIKDKDPEAYRYMQAYLNSLGGIKGGLAGLTDDATKAFSSKMYRVHLDLSDEAKALKAQGNNKGAWWAQQKSNMAKSATEIPQFLQMAQAQMYPAFLGFRVDASVRNLTQPYVYTVQQISTNPAYKAKLIASGLAKTKATPLYTTKNQMKELNKIGLTPADPTPSAFLELRKGIQSGGKGLSGKALEKANNVAMHLYQQSDVANRLTTLNMAKTVTKDVLKDNKHALKYIDHLPSSYRRPAISILKSKATDEQKQEELLKIVASHLNATTQFNYNRASMSEYGRMMGSMWAMFSKWPTAIVGDIVNTMDSNNLRQAKRAARLDGRTKTLANKYIGPLMSLMLVDAVIDETVGEDPIKDFFIPKAGMASSGPIKSATGIFTSPERSLVPPVVSAIKDAANLDFDTTAGLIPYYVYGRFLTERLPLLFGERGQKPPQWIKENIID